MKAIVKQKSCCIGLLGIFLSLQSLTAMSRVPESDARSTLAEQPNILFIFADDWGWGDLSCHGHPYVKTPNIDRLAKEGTDFQRFTVASGVCSPSRAAVVTGHFPARYNINGHFAWVPSNAQRGMPDWLDLEAPFLPRMLQAGGYATAHYGKWHLANNMIPDSPVPGEYGYDDYGAFNCAGEQMPVHEDADNAIAFIEQSHQAGKPFFINLWIHEPHTPFHTVPKYRWRFQDLDEADNIYASVLSHADDRIGEVLDALDRLNIAHNTLVIFSSDNGPARADRSTELTLQHDTATGAGYGLGAAKGITGGRKGYKGALFEGGIGVPFIVRWPGQVAAGVVDKVSLISAVDLLPTFCEVAEVELPVSYEPDGMSQVAVLKGQSAPSREKPLFWKFDSPWPAQATRPDHWVSYAIVDQTWKLLTNKDSSYVELYDIAKDPYESKDLKQQNPEVVRLLLDQIEGWKATLPDSPQGGVFSAERNQ
jgi:arylsulfatase A-like enzyme